MIEIHFPTNHSEIQMRIESINPIKYSKSRNFLDGEVTYLSPYFTHGVISQKEVMDLVLDSYNFKQAEKLIFEFAWREYFQRVWENKSKSIFKNLKNEQTEVISFDFPQSVFTKSIGVEQLDLAVKSLYTNGYIHNHARMWLASVVCNIGKYYWNLPSKWMYFHLLDGDLASNTLSWQWVAGSFSSKKYFANQGNLNKYSKTQQIGTFLDKEYSELVSLNQPSELQEFLTENDLGLKTDLSKDNIQSLTNIKYLDLKDIAEDVFIFHPWMLDPNINVKKQSILFLEKSHFANFPISQKRLKFILDLATNLDIDGLYIGEVEDLKNKKVSSKYYPAIENWKQYSNIEILPRDYMFRNVEGYFGSFFSYWKKCLKSLGVKPGMTKYY